jgi:hypothetical protein
MRATRNVSPTQDRGVARRPECRPRHSTLVTDDTGAKTSLTQETGIVTGSDGRALGTGGAEPLVRQNGRLFIQGKVDGGSRLKDALKIYNYFHQLNRTPKWGEITLRQV